jgi:hypothetical protein
MMNGWWLLLLIPLTFGGLMGFFALMGKLVNLLEERSFRKRFKKRNGRWTDLDSRLPEVDSERKVIDASFYKEGKYVIARSPLCTVCIEDRSIVRYATRLMSKRHGSVKVFSSDEVVGKLVFDRAHAGRYISTFWYGADI